MIGGGGGGGYGPGGNAISANYVYKNGAYGYYGAEGQLGGGGAGFCNGGSGICIIQYYVDAA